MHVGLLLQVQVHFPLLLARRRPLLGGTPFMPLARHRSLLRLLASLLLLACLCLLVTGC